MNKCSPVVVPYKNMKLMRVLHKEKTVVYVMDEYQELSRI
jgi:hypothetical protein